MVLGNVSTKTLVILTSGGAILTTGFGIWTKSVLTKEQGRSQYYQDSIQIIRRHPRALHLLGQPIMDKENNNKKKSVMREKSESRLSTTRVFYLFLEGKL